MTPLLWACGAWLTGVGAGVLLELPIPAIVAAGGASLCAAALFRRNRRFSLALVLLGIASGAAWRAEAHQAAVAYDPLADVRGPVVLRGVVGQEPDRSDSSLRWRLRVVERQEDSGDWVAAGGRVLVWSRHLPSVQYGDLVEIEGRLESAPVFDRFDYAAYLARQGIHGVIRYPTLSVLSGGHGEPLVNGALQVRRALSASLDRLLPEPQNALAQGILLGIRSGMSRPLLEDFRITGTTHILAISGHNMAVVAGMLALVLGRRFSRRSWTFVVVASAFLGGYALLVGLPPSVARAALMASLAYAAGALGRETYPIGGLGFAAAMMTLINPNLLLDAGFQLSFGAMGGILLFSPTIQRWLTARLLPERLAGWRARLARLVAEGAAATVAATLVTFPIQAFTFGQVTLVALPATVFALPFMALLLPAAGAAAVLGVLPAPLSLAAVPAAAVTWLLATGMTSVVQAWAQAPFASVTVPAGEAVWLAAYLPLVAILLWLSRRPSRPGGEGAVDRGYSMLRSLKSQRSRLALATLLTVTAVVWWQVLAPSDTVTVHLFDVGGGEATLVENASGQRVLIDGGPSGPVVSRLLSEALPPWDRTIDLVVLTSPKPQNLSGLLEVLRRYDVRAVAESGLTADTPEYAEWQRLTAESKLARQTLRQGMRINLDGATLRVLHPSEPWLHNVRTGVDRSDTSVVVELEAYGQRVVLASDVRARGVLAMRDRGVLQRGAVLKAPASSGVTALKLLSEIVQPTVIVLSGSELELGRLPPSVLQDAAEVRALRTDLDGTVRLTLTRDSARLQGARPRPDEGRSLPP